jgi:type IV pilus assembly protein PilB
MSSINVNKKGLKKGRIKLGDILVASGLLTETDLQNALEAQKIQEKYLGEILISMGLVNDKQIGRALSKQLNLHFVNLENTQVSEEAIDLVPVEIAVKYRLIPIRKNNNNLVVAMSNPLEYDAVQDLRFLTECRISLVVASISDVMKCLEKYYPKIDISKEITDKDDLETTIELVQIKDEEDPLIQDLQNQAGLAPVIRFANSVIADAIRSNASDIHIEPQKISAHKKKTVIRCRIDGVMRDTLKADINIHPALVSRIKIISGMDISERRVPQDGKAQVNYGNESFDLRVSTIPTTYGEKVTMRILNPATARMNPEDLGLTHGDLKKVLESLERPQGIILVTGPTGSGKSSSLYAFLNRLNKPEVNIITVEDPVEFDVSGINQVQINTKAGITFARGLRAILRQDPDIVMMGEIRDSESARIAFQAAQTGHLVLSTLHTNDAPSAITRLMDLGIGHFQISDALVAVIGQRLVRRIHTDCKVKDELDPELMERIAPFLSETRIPTFYKGSGCQECSHTGYSGRMGLYEILMVTPSLKALINPNINGAIIKEEATKEGFKSLIHDGIQKAGKGITSLSEVFRVAPPDILAERESIAVRQAAGLAAQTADPQDLTRGKVSIHKEYPAFVREERAEFSGNNIKIVVAEDDVTTQMILCDALESQGYQIITADNGKQALEIILGKNPDLVVTDYMMPEMDGLQLIQALKARETTKDIPILMLTSMGELDSEILVMKAGADHFLPKPINRQRFLIRVENLAKRILKRKFCPPDSD